MCNVYGLLCPIRRNLYVFHVLYCIFFIYVFFFSGKEFEVLIDSHGPDHVTQLMQKVISALEHLERMSAARDNECETIENLQTTISHLELEDLKKNEERQRNAKV